MDTRTSGVGWQCQSWVGAQLTLEGVAADSGDAWWLVTVWDTGTKGPKEDQGRAGTRAGGSPFPHLAQGKAGMLQEGGAERGSQWGWVLVGTSLLSPPPHRLPFSESPVLLAFVKRVGGQSAQEASSLPGSICKGAGLSHPHF